MLSTEEKAFLEYWEQNREKTNHWTVHLRTGIFYGLIFSLPILINYLSGWFTNIRMRLPGTLTFICIATGGIAIFFSIFFKRYQWERKEQYYQELKAKEKKNE